MDDYDFSWGLDDYGGDYSSDTGYLGDTGDSWNASDVDANSPWTDYGDSGLLSSGSSGTGGSTTGNDYWTKWLMNAGLTAAGGYFQGQAQEKMTKEEEANREKFYAFQKAEDEKYYQAHGKQLSDNYAKYKGFYSKPTAHGPNNPTSLFGLLAPRTPETDAVNGFAFDPAGDYPPMGATTQPQPATGVLGYPYGHSTHGY